MPNSRLVNGTILMCMNEIIKKTIDFTYIISQCQTGKQRQNNEKHKETFIFFIVVVNLTIITIIDVIRIIDGDS